MNNELESDLEEIARRTTELSGNSNNLKRLADHPEDLVHCDSRETNDAIRDLENISRNAEDILQAATSAAEKLRRLPRS